MHIYIYAYAYAYVYTGIPWGSCSHLLKRASFNGRPKIAESFECCG